MNTIKRYWITKEAMSELCARHGIRPPWEQQEPQPPAAVAPVVALEQAPGGDERQVAPGGRPSTNAEAYAYIDDLMADGMNLGNACFAAASKFPRGDPKKREASLHTGYIAYRRKRMSKANKPR